jgi:hypothetical protein
MLKVENVDKQRLYREALIDGSMREKMYLFSETFISRMIDLMLSDFE